MVDLRALNTLAFMTDIVGLDACELHLGWMRKSSTTLVNGRFLYYKGSLSFKSILVYNC